MRTRGTPLTALLLSTLVCGGCSTDERESAVSLAPLEQPPESIPPAFLLGVPDRQAGAVIASRWPDQAGAIAETAPEEFVPWPDPIQASSNPPTIELATSAMPARVEVRTFAAVDSQGVPADDGTVYTCRTLVQDGDACVVSRGGETLSVELPRNLQSHVVVYVEWYVPVEMRGAAQHVGTRAASYAFRIDIG